jgi:carboxylesterase type B
MKIRTKLQIALLAAIAFQFPLDVSGQTCSELRYIDPLFDVETTSNVEYQQARAYGSLINQAFRMDIYKPVGDTMTYRPLMVFQFGGGFLIGDKLLPPAPAYCSYWAERGYVAVSIDYRLGFNA